MNNILYATILITSATSVSSFARAKPALVCKASELSVEFDGDVPKFRPLVLEAASALSSITGNNRDLKIEVKEDTFILNAANSDEIITLNFKNQSSDSFAAQRAPHQNTVTVYAYLKSATITASGQDDASFGIDSPRRTTMNCVSTLAASK